jgi:hypothetical protein
VRLFHDNFENMFFIGYINKTSLDDVKRLIDFVKNQEALYNVKYQDYRTVQLKNNRWVKVEIRISTNRRRHRLYDCISHRTSIDATIIMLR